MQAFLRWSCLASLAGLVAIGVSTPAHAGGLSCAGDTNEDLVVNVSDLVNVILCWDTSGQNCIPGGGDADLNDDGIVDVQDLVSAPQSVILNWGPCDVGPPPNDDCLAAETLFIGAQPVVGTTIEAMSDPDAFACGVGVEAPGVWYRVIGNEEELTATLCSSPLEYDSRLVVYCGPCNDLTCIGGDDDGCTDITTSTLSKFTWCTAPSQEYLIYVTGGAGAQGSFKIAIEGGPVCGPPTQCEAELGNDECSGAELLTDGLHEYDTNPASTDGPMTPAGCNDSGDNQTWNDLWFRYVATQTGVLFISNCQAVDPNAFTDHDSEIVIYDGTDCGNLTFLACNDNDPGCATLNAVASTVLAEVVMGNEYLIRVGGATVNDRGFATMRVACLPADDAFCEFATELFDPAPGNGAVNGTVTLDTNGVMFSTPGLACFTTENDGPGRWIRVAGTGNQVTIEGCGVPIFTFDTQTTIYCGPCSDPTCIGTEPSDDAFCDIGTERVSWCTEVGVDYYIRIGGSANQTGVVDVTIEETGPCGNPPCP